ncbi:hypothetical protein BKA62DRAFT_691332 [Auriculariales sp. MPI-PUGE-AT-0066]|nr:hypothetical protein BKA62DRAFT_691332 [Auriculariales sp. MPI-PUGE-AT-0066]
MSLNAVYSEWSLNQGLIPIISCAAVLASTVYFARRVRVKATIRVTELYVHPIKSCRGTSVQSTRFTPTGLEVRTSGNSGK